MDYPLYIDGEKKGRLRITRDGLLTCVRAECPDMGRVLRISVFGGGKSACLGVMLPEDGRMVLRKSFTKLALQSFPETVEYAADRELEHQKSAVPETEPDGLLWFSTTSGSLTAFDGRQSLIALPADERLIADKSILRLIDGRYYAVFPGKAKKVLEK